VENLKNEIAELNKIQVKILNSNLSYEARHSAVKILEKMKNVFKELESLAVDADLLTKKYPELKNVVRF
jgi:predicted phage-related endonuclease